MCLQGASAFDHMIAELAAKRTWIFIVREPVHRLIIALYDDAGPDFADAGHTVLGQGPADFTFDG